ncbi:cytidylyltransferase domain-containing protein (plasmid) [Tundrisphaera lichenicola]|uniref:cytidylyltransferase domain-containing protein n=1 Tax=Tundrisphaera lichenicola TaxID=2029860 RepID=UPI003EBACF90
MNETLVIIPAHGGSKEIPRKYVLPVAGKPLLGWTIDAARNARRVSRVVVSTDDADIAAVARRFGAQMVDRPSEISGDSTSSEATLLHVLEHLEETEGYRPILVAFLRCTSPLTASQDIDGTIEALERDEADTALAVIPFHDFLWKTDADGGGVGINHDKRVRLLGLECEPQFLESGAVYVMKAAGFRESRHRFFGKTALYEMPGGRRWEIDDPVDLEVAGVLLRAGERQGQASLLPEKLGAIIFDFDGVFTDNRVWVMQDGREAVACSRGDGMGLDLLRKAGWPMLVLSKESNPVVSARAAKLKLECLQGIDDKRTALLDWLGGRGIAPSDVIYLGNDINDLPCLGLVGCPAVVADAHPDVMPAARLVLKSPGGFGAVRELADVILSRYGASPHA